MSDEKSKNVINDAFELTNLIGEILSKNNFNVFSVISACEAILLDAYPKSRLKEEEIYSRLMNLLKIMKDNGSLK